MQYFVYKRIPDQEPFFPRIHVLSVCKESCLNGLLTEADEIFKQTTGIDPVKNRSIVVTMQQEDK